MGKLEKFLNKNDLNKCRYFHLIIIQVGGNMEFFFIIKFKMDLFTENF